MGVELKVSQKGKIRGASVKAFMFKITARCKYKRGDPGSRLHVQSKLSEACYPIRALSSLSNGGWVEEGEGRARFRMPAVCVYPFCL